MIRTDWVDLNPLVSDKVMVYKYDILTRYGPERSRENERFRVLGKREGNAGKQTVGGWAGAARRYSYGQGEG